MTPEHFQTTYLAWAAMIVAVLSAPVTAVLAAKAGKIFGTLKSGIEAIEDRQNRQSKAIAANTDRISTIALQTPTPAAAPPAATGATSTLPPAQVTLPPEVSDAIKALGDHAASITNAVADINKSQSLTRAVADGDAGKSPVLDQTPTTGGAVIITGNGGSQ